MPRLLALCITAALCLLAPTLYWVSSTRPSSIAADISLRSSDLHLRGDVIMPKLANETVRAELGRASWKLLHTMAQRYPEHPTHDQREAYASFLHLLARLFPCGECAQHFQELLQRYPPQTASRTSAAMHLCSLHNKVNERLGKPDYDCSQLEGDYECGCGDDPPSTTQLTAMLAGRIDPRTGETMESG